MGMRFFKRKEDGYEKGFDDAVELLDWNIHERLHWTLESIPGKKRGQRRGFLNAIGVVADVFDVYAMRDGSAREFTQKSRAYWKATASFNEGNGSISKEWDSLGN